MSPFEIGKACIILKGHSRTTVGELLLKKLVFTWFSKELLHKTVEEKDVLRECTFSVFVDL